MYFSDFISDSVGIRTQDPQLRRLLLYPAELPNRSVLLSGVSGADSKSGCKYRCFCCNMQDLRKRLLRQVSIV